MTNYYFTMATQHSQMTDRKQTKTDFVAGLWCERVGFNPILKLPSFKILFINNYEMKFCCSLYKTLLVKLHICHAGLLTTTLIKYFQNFVK